MIKVQDVTTKQADKFLFDPVSFEVFPGQILVVQGNNGSGKTTLLRFLAAIDAGYEGTIIREKALVHTYVGHANGLKPALSLKENLSFLANLFKLSLSKVDIAMEKMGLEHLAHVPIKFLSKGQRQRGALCRLFLRKTNLWLLDEPMVSLDQDSQNRFWGLAQEHLNHAGAIVITSHTNVPLKNTAIYLRTP